VVIRGQVESVQQKKDKCRLVVKANAWEHKGIQGKISEKLLIRLKGDLVGIENPQIIVGKNVQFKGKVSYPTERRNPGLFDYRLYLKTRKIYMIIDGPASYLTLMGTGNQITETLAKIKYRFTEALDARMSEDVKGLMLGMLFIYISVNCSVTGAAFFHLSLD
jgi:competence protein ComEC